MSRVIDPATVDELAWSQMYNRFNCNPIKCFWISGLLQNSERGICKIPLESKCARMTKN
jgi:hypothetical protein